jgi:hypothetical protein
VTLNISMHLLWYICLRHSLLRTAVRAADRRTSNVICQRICLFAHIDLLGVVQTSSARHDIVQFCMQASTPWAGHNYCSLITDQYPSVMQVGHACSPALHPFREGQWYSHTSNKPYTIDMHMMNKI